jgi:hypothetical protein
MSCLTGAGVRVAGIGHNGPRVSFPHATRADLYRRGADLVGREQSRGGRRNIRNNQSKISFWPLVRPGTGAESFDITENARGLKALGRQYRTGNRTEFYFHQTSAVSFLCRGTITDHNPRRELPI